MTKKTGLCATREAHGKDPDPQADDRIQITDGHHKWTLHVEYKAHVDRVATLHAVQNQLRGLTELGLLVRPYLGPELARNCQEMGLPFLDAAGNAFLKLDGLFALVTGQKPDKTQRQTDKHCVGGAGIPRLAIVTLFRSPIFF